MCTCCRRFPTAGEENAFKNGSTLDRIFLRKVCLSVEDEKELEYYLERVQEASLPFALIKDAGLTEVAPGTVTCLV